jgi:hypothetical protein
MNLLTLVLVVLSGSSDFRVREYASKSLFRMSEVSPSVILAGECNRDYEVRKRCQMVMDKWYQRHAESLVAMMEPEFGWPWCGVIPVLIGSGGEEFIANVKHPAVWSPEDRLHYLFIAKGRVGMCHPWVTYREATRLWMVDLVSQRRDARSLLQCLTHYHLQQCSHYGYPLRYGLPERVPYPEN